MLDYYNILSSRDKEVRDPVSGHSFPKSVNDIHAEKRVSASQNQDSRIASLLSSILK